MAALGIYLMGALLLVGAGVLKAWRPADTARAIAATVPWTPPRLWPHAVRWFATGEAILGIIAIVYPSVPAAVAMAATFAVFTGFVLYARSTGGVLATCGCFGSPDTPPTAMHAALTALVAAGCVVVAAAAPSGSVATVLGRQYLDGVPLIAAGVIAAWLAFLVMGPLARLQSLRRAKPLLSGGRL